MHALGLFALFVSLAASAPSPQTFVDTFEDKPASPIDVGTGKSAQASHHSTLRNVR